MGLFDSPDIVHYTSIFDDPGIGLTPFGDCNLIDRYLLIPRNVMRKYNFEDLIQLIKNQVQTFLLNAGEFYPFGTCMDIDDQLVPVGIYLEDDHPSSLELIDMLEADFHEKIANEEYKIAVVVVDVNIKQNGFNVDAMELRFIEPNNVVRKEYIKYITHSNFIEFI